MKTILLLLFTLGFTDLTIAQSILYVNQNVQGGQQDASSWANATPDLQLALDLALSGDAIWVAAGTYFPTATTDRSISFFLKQGVKLYGGFAGDEVLLAERDYALHETILSGNIGDPNTVTDNSLHVLQGFAVDSTTLLNGFTVTQGYAYGLLNSPNDGKGGGLLLLASPILDNTCPGIQNCLFRGNFAGVGGAIYCKWDFENLVNPIIRNCQFISNRAVSFAGALYKGSPSKAEQPFTVENCLFLKNRAVGGEGGAVFLTSMRHNALFKNCRFEKDTASTNWGAGINCLGFAETGGSAGVILDSCTFSENYGSEGTGFCYVNLSAEHDTFYCEINNCNFEKNKTTNGTGASIFLEGFESSKIFFVANNTTFIGNRSKTAGAVRISGEGAEIQASFQNCTFIDNVDFDIPPASSHALILVAKTGTMNINNCIFARNGAGVFIGTPEDGKVVSHINNCTFFRNGKYPFDKSWYNSFHFTNEFYNECYINNCIFWESRSSNIIWNGNPFNITAYGYHFDHTALSLHAADTLMPGGIIAFGDHNIFKDQYPQFTDTLSDDYRLLPCSPAVNAGNNVIVDTLGLLTDLDGLPRVFANTVDMGAYETQDACFTSGSAALLKEHFPATLQPNPARCGETIRVETGLLSGSIERRWRLVALNGQTILSGIVQPTAVTYHFTAPTRPGLYYWQLQGLTTPQKLVVTPE